MQVITRFQYKGESVEIRLIENGFRAAHYDVYINGSWMACRWFAHSAQVAAMKLIDDQEASALARSHRLFNA
jgi:hypothetical protein